MKKSKLNLKIISLILLVDILESVYEFFFKKGMNSIGEFHFSNMSVALAYATKILSSGWIWLGLAVIIIETLMWVAVLSKIDLSLAFPLASSSYIFVLIISIIFLHENVTICRAIGTIMIILGIIIVTKTSEHEPIDG